MKQLGNSVAVPAIQVVAEKNNWETWVMQYNKGEWSKLYASLVIFNEWSIPAANHNLNETKERYYFLEAIREDAPGKIKHYNLEKDGVVEVLDDNEHIKRIVTIDDLPSKTRRIFEKNQIKYWWNIFNR